MIFNIDIPYEIITGDNCEIIIHIEEGIISGADRIRGRASIYTSLYKYMDISIQDLQAAGRIRTAENYRSTLNSFRKFMKGKDVALEEVNPELMQKYQAYLTESGLVLNTVSFYMRILRSVYFSAVKTGITEDRHPFKEVYTGISKTSKRALCLDSIKKIYESKPSNPSISFAKDMFLFSFYTRGMSFIDMAGLTTADLKNGVLKYRRSKTKQCLRMAWTKEMQQILDSHPSKDGIHLLDILNCDEAVPAREQFRQRQVSVNYFLKKLGKELGICNALTMYVARHSWASIARQMNVPLNIISDGMGHTSERTTRVYLTSVDANELDLANSRIIGAVTMA